MAAVSYLILKMEDHIQEEQGPLLWVLAGLLSQILLCPQMYCPLGKVLQILIKVTDLTQGLAA